MTHYQRYLRLPALPKLIALGTMLVGVAGCSCDTPYRLSDRSCVSANLMCRTGNSLDAPACPREVVYPNGIALQDELAEEEAVLMALWNNAAFLELLADLGIAQGDLVQAGLLPNPEVAYFFPVSDKPFKYAFDFPIEALWLRPIRIAAAEREYGRACERLTQAGLDLIRDTRQAYADAILAERRAQIAADIVSLRRRIAGVTETRLDSGDISPQESSTAVIDASRAEQDTVRAGYDVDLAHAKLRHLMGVPEERVRLRLVQATPPLPATVDVDALSAEATTNRPDLLAADQASAAAAERLRLSKLIWFRVLGILDATSGRDTGHEFGPAVRTTLPIFNWNQGNIARAEAELEKAERQRQTVRNQVFLDVQQSHLRYVQSRAELDVLRSRVRNDVETAISRTETAYKEGETSYVVVLQTTQQLIDSRVREAQLETELRRAWADLERSVGRHLIDASTTNHRVEPLTAILPEAPQDAPAVNQPPHP